jgi:pyruvate,water dikinase
MRVVRAKIESRRRNCELIDEGKWDGPMYIRGNSAAAPNVDNLAGEEHEEGLFRGVGTSRGCVVGTARLAATQKDIGKVQAGEILVCHATDPGWTSVFMVAGAAVFETGGMLAHCSCISREYGIPAVQVVNALRLIEDGSTIEVNGDTGQVRVLAPPAARA